MTPNARCDDALVPVFPPEGTVKVIGLGDPDDEPMIDDSYGIICEAKHERRSIDIPLDELDVKKNKPNRQLIEDYAYWLHNWS